MARSVKKKGKKFRHNLKNRANAVKKAVKKKNLSRSSMKLIKEGWETNKTPRQNIASFGLAFDPNEAVPVKQPKREIIDLTPVEGVNLQENVRALEAAVAERRSKLEEKKKKMIDNDKANLMASTLKNQIMEEEKKNQGRTFKLLDRDMELCIYMIERYGNDFKAMSRDPKNLFQYTPKQMAKKVRIYQQSPYYCVLENKI